MFLRVLKGLGLRGNPEFIDSLHTILSKRWVAYGLGFRALARENVSWGGGHSSELYSNVLNTKNLENCSPKHYTLERLITKP